MPIYEYECLTCGNTFEKRQGFNEPAIADCPNGHPETRRRLSTPAIVFKGSGFYVTDNKNGSSHTKASKSETSTETKSETASNTTSETKSESKAEAASA